INKLETYSHNCQYKKYHKAVCSGRNNTDLVGVTWPRAGAQKSRYWLQYCRIPKSRIGKCGRTESKCKEGRSSERLVGTLLKGIRLTVRNN
ncbi:putative bromodomain and WD repeat-containing protein 2, partial [Trichinella spiralis]|uniref:putative bromodomain and WD repeat-containing protein 2 n=1 Tax=Trichinella spiralis TaxID=6334 RepID=UPI0001EFC86D